MKNKTYWIAETAVMIALLVALQWATKPLGQFVTGSCVNLVLGVSTLVGGVWCGAVVAIASPFCAFLVGVGPAKLLIVPFIAVGNVVLNRVRSAEFPESIRAVVFDRKDGVQFEPVSNGSVYDEPTARSVLAAKAALAGTDIVGGCLYFYAPALSQGTWIKNNRTYYTTIGCHRFYL